MKNVCRMPHAYLSLRRAAAIPELRRSSAELTMPGCKLKSSAESIVVLRLHSNKAFADTCRRRHDIDSEKEARRLLKRLLKA